MGAGSPLEALGAQALHRPLAPALRAKRHGRWFETGWSDLSRRVREAARGWAALGLLRGGAVASVGPLSPAFVITLLAAAGQGTQVRVAGDEAALLGSARLVLAEGEHELERVLRHAGPALEVVVLADAAALAGASARAGVRLLSFDQLLALGAAAAEPAHGLPFAAPAPLARVEAPERGVDARLAPPTAGGADIATAGQRAFAEFAPGWLPGAAWLLGPWLQGGATLVLPEPGGDAAADRHEAAATGWLAPGARVRLFADELRQRTPARGLAGAVTRAALAGASHPLAAFARRRIRAGSGLARTERLLTDADAAAEALALLAALGVERPPLAQRPWPPLALAGEAP